MNRLFVAPSGVAGRWFMFVAHGMFCAEKGMFPLRGFVLSEGIMSAPITPLGAGDGNVPTLSQTRALAQLC